MNIEKRTSAKSTSWRITGYIDGVRYRVTVDHEPSEREANKLIREKAANNKPKPVQDFTFANAVDSYCNLKAAVLSPATIRGYDSIKKNLPADFTGLKLSLIDSIRVQKAIGDYAKDHSAKSTKNAYGLITTVMALYCPGVVLNAKLPMLIHKEPYIPTNDDVRKLCELAKPTKYWCVVMLGAYGLRRSEICALTIDDLDGNMLTINKALVYGLDGKWIVKETKTAESTRQIYIDDAVADRIRQQGYIYKGSPSSIFQWISKAEREAGMEHFSLHKLRHYFATVMSTVLPEADWLRLGGWKTDHVAKTVYRHAQIDREVKMKKEAAAALQNFINPKETSPQTSPQN